jgi:GTP pyrophosphokinase
MVNASSSTPRHADGRIDVARWLERLEDEVDAGEGAVAGALDLITGLKSRSDEFLEKGVELANLVLTLNMDSASVAAALLYRPVRTGSLPVSSIRRSLPEGIADEVAGLVESVARLADTSLLEMSNSRMQTSESRDQIENIKRMLVSMVDDARVAVLKLAERVIALRAAKASSTERQQRIAQEAHQVFAPLANRLGVWQLKWELEDLALRYLAPDIYKTIARQLKGRRAEREKEIQDIAQVMEARLAAKNIDAKVFGRAKHIFSIWRKMRSKNVGLEEVYDVRAIRVLVPDIGQCYSTLGVIHTEWQHIPSEFDDYIAVPKENGYRSIHTAVSWDDGKTLEVQIRTPEMHEESELGVCAHWAYKDGVSEDESFAMKMDWMRQVVEWQEEAEHHLRQHQIGLELGHRVREERIFVYTPKGHVLDLITGATALDFAYRVHTEVGHRCRGARVDGRRIPLNQPLESGQRVEVLTGDMEAPSRTWLHQHLECIRTARAREKISEWFHDRPQTENLEEGRTLISRAFARMGLVAPASSALKEAARRLGYDSEESCLIALGTGDCQIVDLLQEVIPAGSEAPDHVTEPSQMSLIDEPVLPVHSSGTSFHIEMLADDRAGLLMDITSFLGVRDIMLLSNSGRVLPGTGDALITIEVRLESLIELHKLMDALEMIPTVRAAKLITNQISQGANT